MNRIAIILLMTLSLSTGAHAGDAAKGEKVFKKCKACHVVDKEKNKTGQSYFFPYPQHGMLYTF